METINGFLSRKAQTLWPKSLVVYEDVPGRGREYHIKRGGEKVCGLGKSFEEAKASVEALIRYAHDDTQPAQAQP